MRSSRTLTLLTAVAVAGTLLAPAVGAQTYGADISYQSIPGHGGTPMRGFVVTPTGRGDGPFPLLVMPASWGAPNRFPGTFPQVTTLRLSWTAWICATPAKAVPAPSRCRDH